MRGSVYKRCSCPREHDKLGRRKSCRKDHGSWVYVADLGNDPATGKRRQARKSGFQSKDEADKALAKFVAAVDSGTVAHDNRITVALYLQQWIAGKEFEGLRPSTIRSYSQHIDDHLVPRIGRLRLGDLRGSVVAQTFRDIQAETGVSAATLQRIRATLRSALNDAVPEMITINPAVGVKLPSGKRPRVQPWDPDELGWFLDQAGSDRLGPLFEVLAFTGMRRGEACGLRWSDVDLNRRVIVVRQQITEFSGNKQDCPTCGVQHGRMAFGPPKTSSGDGRVVHLDQDRVGVLLALMMRQEDERELWGDAYADHDLVFAREDGMPTRPSLVSETFGHLVAAAGVRTIRLHDLRHGKASLMLASGTPLAIVSKELGHASYAFTADTYSHLLAGVGHEAADKSASIVPRGQAMKPSRDHSVTTPVTNIADDTRQ